MCLEFRIDVCLWNTYLYLCVRVCTLNIQYLHTCLCLYVCPLLCTHAIGVEVIPFGLFNRHQLSFVLQEMDAADYYPRIHKFFMCKLKLYGLMNSVCETVQAKCPSTPQPTPPSRSMVKIKRCIFFIFLHLYSLFSCMPCSCLFPSFFLQFLDWACLAGPKGANLLSVLLFLPESADRIFPTKYTHTHWKIVLVRLRLHTYPSWNGLYKV